MNDSKTNYGQCIPDPYHIDLDALRLEVVIVCVGFDDILEYTLIENHAHFDTIIVVTSHDDQKTHAVANKSGATLVMSSSFTKDERHFNKGAAISEGFSYYRYHGWRMCMDADILLPDNFRRVLFNSTHLDRSAIYGADRMDMVSPSKSSGKPSAVSDWLLDPNPQSRDGYFIHPGIDQPISPRYVDNLSGYCPLGYFQLWHATCQKSYPYSRGTAAHDDVMFARLWPHSHRRLLPTVLCYHLCATPPILGENWDGTRRQPRLDR